MDTKDLLAHLCEIEDQLIKAAERVDETKDTFNNRWLRSRLLEIECEINGVKLKVEELQEIYTF